MDVETSAKKNLKFYVINNGLISASGMSGSDQRALNWVKIFNKRGHDITLVIPEVGRDRFKDFDCIITPGGVLSGGIGLFIGYLKRAIMSSYQLWEKLPNSGDTVIYSSSDLIPDAVPAIYCKLKRPAIKWISGLHLVAPNPFKGFVKTATSGFSLPTIANTYYFLSQRLIMNFMKKHAHTVMVSNSLDREFLLKKGFSGDKVIVTYGAVCWEDVDKAVGKKFSYDACYVGRFHKQKGFSDLVEAWGRVCKIHPEAQIAVIGDDINFQEMVKNVEERGLSGNIKFLGYQSGVDKFNIMKSSKLCLFPSTYESFGMVAAEAMACGLPVVAYHLPVYDEIYPVGMLKADIGDINSLTAHILTLLDDEKKRTKISKEAYRLSKSFTWEKTADQILKRLN